MKNIRNIQFGNYLAYRRKLKNFSQQYVATRLRVRREIVRDREAGINIQLDFIQTIAIDIYNETFEDFLKKFLVYIACREEQKNKLTLN